MKKLLSDWWFNTLTSHFLIYNTCWEDPAIDRSLLQMDASSDIFMITSAGDNAFDYLLDDVHSIHSVDLNPYQNGLCELKKAFYITDQVDRLQDLFITGKSKNAINHLSSVKEVLSDSTYAYWKQNIHWFMNDRGFYEHSLSGRFAQLLRLLLHQKGIYEQVIELIHMEGKENRRDFYSTKIYPQLWSGFGQRIWKNEWVLSLAGVPSNQLKGTSGLNSYMKEVIENVFVRQGAQENYFWRLYIEGEYNTQACPNYLKTEFASQIRAKVDRIKLNTTSTYSALKNSAQTYSHFILLDHMDWFIDKNPIALEQLWRGIIKRAKPGAKILFRSVYPTLDKFPEIVQDHCTLLPIDENYLDMNDRVNTYQRTFLAQVNV